MKPFHEVVLSCRTTHMRNTSFGVFSEDGNMTGIVTTFAKMMPWIYTFSDESNSDSLFPGPRQRPLLPTSVAAHTSHRIMGKSTWMQGCSSFTIPCRVKQHFQQMSNKPGTHTRAPSLTCGIRFFWILFSLDFLRPFLVTTVSS